MFFRKAQKRKEKIIGHLQKEERAPQNTYTIDIDDRFVEQSTSALNQLKKLHYSFLDIMDNVITSIVPNSLLVVEMLDESVSIAIISKKGIFFDINYLKNFTFFDLHEVYQRIVGKEVPFEHEWYESLENIITIISYETIYSLPKRIVVIQNRNCDFLKVTIKSGRFKDKNFVKSAIKKEFELLSGYKNDEVYTNFTPIIGSKEQITHFVSATDKDYFNHLEEYLDDSEFVLKRFHSIKSSLFASFFVKNKETKVRVHIVGDNAYVMQKLFQDEFEYRQLNLNIDYEELELLVRDVSEMILSGSGEYYTQIKNSFAKQKINIRTYNYNKDMNRCIVRVESGIVLDNAFATVLSTAYHELFKINFSAIRLGVTKNYSIYEHLRNNTNILPFAVMVFVLLFAYGSHRYLTYKLSNVTEQYKHISQINSDKEKKLQSIKNIKNSIANLEKKNRDIHLVLTQKKSSQDALLLDEIAAKLPNDMILTKIQKIEARAAVGRGKKKVAQEPSKIILTGKCFQESSLLQYIESLQIENKNVYLKSLQDTKTSKGKLVKNMKHQQNQKLSDAIANKTRTLFQELFSYPNKEKQKNPDLSKEFLERLQNIEKLNLEKREIYFADTLKNTFVLEIR